MRKGRDIAVGGGGREGGMVNRGRLGARGASLGKSVEGVHRFILHLAQVLHTDVGPLGSAEPPGLIIRDLGGGGGEIF